MKDKETPHWWSDNRFWSEFAPLMFDVQRWNDSAGDVDGMIKLTGIAAPSGILDVGCGPGRHSLELARRGYHVTGIDINDSYLKTAEDIAVSEGLTDSVEFRHCDMREITSGEPFSAAFSFFQSLGYFEDPEDDLRVCRRIYEVLEPDGVFLIEMDGKEATAASFEEKVWFEREGRIILLENKAEAAWSMLYNRWQFRDTDGSWHEYEFSYRLYSAVELGLLLEKAGFSSIEFFGSVDGKPYDENAKRLVALARR